MFNSFDINSNGLVDGVDFLLLDTVVFPTEEENLQLKDNIYEDSWSNIRTAVNPFAESQKSILFA